MRIAAILCALACWAVLCGCSVAQFGKSVGKNQARTVRGLLYMDTIFTDDGRPRLTESLE